MHAWHFRTREEEPSMLKLVQQFLDVAQECQSRRGILRPASFLETLLLRII